MSLKAGVVSSHRFYEAGNARVARSVGGLEAIVAIALVEVGRETWAVAVSRD